MISGRLKDQILIYAENETPNEFAEREKSYAYSFPVRAEISFQNGTEQMFAQMSQAAKTIKFKVRFHMSRFNERQLIRFRDQFYNIRSIDPDRDRTYLILTADRIPLNSVTITTQNPNPPIPENNSTPSQTIAYSATPTHNWFFGNNAIITLTGNVTTYTLSNVLDGAEGDISVIQDEDGGYGIQAIAHAGLTVKYQTNGLAPTAENINSEPAGHTIITYKRIGLFLYITNSYYLLT